MFVPKYVHASHVNGFRMSKSKTKFDPQTTFPLSRRPRHVHIAHADCDAVEPDPTPYVPALQLVHTPTPVVEPLYVPDGQRKHDCQCTSQAGHTSAQTPCQGRLRSQSRLPRLISEKPQVSD